MSNEIYTAITIGPICKTLDKARSVKSFWTASYLFSWIMRELLERLPKEERPEGSFEVLSPHRDGKDVPEETSKKVGLFPDRLFAKGELEEEKLQEIKGKIFIELAEKFKNAFQDEKDGITRKIDTESDPKRKRELEEIQSRYSNAALKGEDIRKYLENYLSISCITVELSSDCNILEQLNSYLDTQELFNKASIQTDEDYMELFIEAPNNPFLKAYSQDRAFPSTSEIAVSGWEQDPPKDENGEVEYTQLTSKPGFRNCYKYLAVIKADGDGFGTYIKELKVDEEKEIKENGEKENELSRFTKSFFEFSVEVANELIQKTKAIPVYIGGDDLFLFAPVLEGNVEKDVFNLIKEIDDLFIQKEIGEGLSMSYGVSIFYYKSPMSEAIDIADSMLRKAKEEKEEKEKKKDTVAISIQKHSGQKIEFLLPCKHSTDKCKQETGLYKKATELIRAFKEDDSMLNSLIYWIEDMYETIFTDEVTLYQERINAVFDNFFDEEIHKENEVFFDLLKKFIHSMHHSEDTPRKLKDKKKLLHGILRYCQFVTAKKEK
ncbi:CRISPR-associated protein, TM1811 family [Porphyromonas gingivalis W83]|uniref:CRISPR-associated protein, TM1811 family n=1 Tax=Porphyromonas gingivalis (strain ATCC BAA-308 / W83) TaxID=242619 RepID=Q7MTH2_PORGI|nr:type III-B CRISPR-associated protein Cas10/Cmr2 [Porphyromonas gingivalis]AAQ66960.1 CRISPR-associated protein, TM1811 family [Porphyromonas gingivalis W83]AKV65040.1 CRISPR-associated protein Cas10/Cmr2, subtype III-B [Porphyromonas gingivalis]EIW91545.1 putative CRISPR-associated protein Cas10/Cmr2, subtype III-B [Porphyromonas gingivalis W50]USI93850.1 type III-B CRISPR-associated protein Cas10/Cmr2 [Porphyromonas gingivalis]USI95737.1 type III-B CRISPR-associated protein Cas10/Cmr2 [Por